MNDWKLLIYQHFHKFLKQFLYNGSYEELCMGLEIGDFGMAEKAAITQQFLQRKMEEYEALEAEIEALKSEVKTSDHEGIKKA